MTILRTLIIVALLVAPAVASATQPAASSLPPPRIMQTHSNIFGAVIFWDATPYVERFVTQDTPPKDALASLELEALRIFIDHAPVLARTERHLRVVAAFSKTGPISARYQTSTLEGIQTILTLDGSLHPKMQFPRGWEAGAQRGAMPPGIKLQVVSEIPPK